MPVSASVRTKSAPGYRALGTRSPSLSSHEEVEHEYTFVRAIVDAMAAKNNDQSTPEIPPANSTNLRSRAWPAMYMNDPSGFTFTQASSATPFQRHFGYDSHPFTPIHTLLSRYPHEKDIIPKTKLCQSQTPANSSVGKPETPNHKFRQKPLSSFNSTVAMGEQTMVVPLNSPSLVQLQLSGDSKQIYTQQERLATCHNSAKSRPTGFSHRRNQGKRAASPTVQPVPTTPGRAVHTLVLAPRTDTQETKEHTRYRFRLRSARKNCLSSPRPSTSPEGNSCSRVAITKQSELHVQNVQRLSKPGARSHSRPTMRLTTAPSISSQACQSEHGVTLDVDHSEKIDLDEIPYQGMPGHTRLTKSPGTLSLSVFLPREILSIERSCHRSCTTSQVSNPDTDHDFEEASSTVTEKAFSCTGRAPSSNGGTSTPRQDNTSQEDEEDDEEVYSSGMGFIRQSSELDLRRSIHCELFGSGLCGKCKHHDHRQDARKWQSMVYPGIVADPKLLVAAPMLRRHQSRFGMEPSYRYHKSRSVVPTSRPHTSSESPPLMYSSATPDQTVQQKSTYGGHPWRLTGPGSHLTRTLKSVVTQDEIKTRMWAMSDSPRSRRQGVAIVT